MGQANGLLYLSSAMTLRKDWFCSLGLIALLFGCSTDHKQQNFSYLRSPAYFKVDTTLSNHAFCADYSGTFASQAECMQAKKYRLSWLRPEDTTKFSGYRIYVDTIPPNTPTGRHWADVQRDPKLANLIVETTSPTDSVIFIFGKREFKQDTLRKNNTKIYIIDTTSRQETESGRLVFALVPVYAGDATPGQPQYSWFIVNDKFPPDIFSPRIKPGAHEIAITWQRPTDPTSFFDANLDSGLIRTYLLKLTLGGRITADRKQAFAPTIKFTRGGKDVTESVRDSLVLDPPDARDKSTLIPKGHIYFLPDSNRAHRASPTLADSLSAVITGLTPRDTLNVQVWAMDSSGNQNANAMATVVVHLTDTTQPSTPKLFVDSSTISSNGFVVRWKPSSDTLWLETGSTEVKSIPNYHIQEYRMRRTLLRDSGEKASLLDRMDTVIEVAKPIDTSTVFVNTMRFLPPGRTFQLKLSALDLTGFESNVDSITVQTPAVHFLGKDSALTCPTGFIPIPRARFTLGEITSGSQPDETPTHIINMGPYCIEPYEHRDSSGQFISGVTWEKADTLCQAMSKDFNSQLCSEAEWERACEGPGVGPDSALLHGIQSEQKNASILQSTCNQGTNDSVMARAFDKRNATCLTREGVYDMAGNFSEWVRDVYSERAYSHLPPGDSLDHAYAYTDSGQVHGFRGGNYLAPQTLLSSVAVQNLARCSNRDYPNQIRPIFRLDCLDSSQPKIAVIYNSGLAGHFCMPLPASLRDKKITDLISAPKDSTKILVFLSGETHPDTISLLRPVGDTLFLKKKPVFVRMTTLSLAVVQFVKPGVDTIIKDTLDAAEMRDTSQSNLAKIFSREAGNSGWMVKQEAGKFVIKYIYAYAMSGTKLPKAYYNNHTISFRCCSLAKTFPIPLPKSVRSR